MKIRHDEDTVQNIVELVSNTLLSSELKDVAIETGLELYANKVAEPLLERIAELEARNAELEEIVSSDVYLVDPNHYFTTDSSNVLGNK